MTAAGQFSVVHPQTMEEAARLSLANPWSRLCAGATGLQLTWTPDRTPSTSGPGLVINLRSVPGHAAIGADASRVRIGALATLGQLEREPALVDALPMLSAAIRTVAAPTIRNLATIGGNIAGRTGCLLPALLALDARLEGVCAGGPWSQTIEQWVSRPSPRDEIIAAVIVPRISVDACWTQRKIGLRAAFTPSVIGVAGILEMAGDVIVAARLAVGGGTVRPARLPATEALLVNQRLSGIDWAAVRASAGDEIDAPDDVFRTRRYRKRAGSNALVHGLGGLSASTRDSSLGTRVPASNGAASTGEIEVSRQTLAGRWHARPDGPAKIAGGLAYLTDHRQPGMLVGRILRAGIPHARIVAIQTSKAEALAGVAAVVTHKDVPGLNAFGIVIQDQPALCNDTVRYAGDAVAAVAAIDAQTADAALALIEVTYEALPILDTPDRALSPDALPIHSTGNLQRRIDYARGAPDSAFSGCTHIIDETYVTPRQMHGFMETEGGWAEVEPDGTLAIHAGGQHGARDRLQLSRILNRPEATIRVVTSPTGGAFGGKDELTVQPALALLTLKTGRPVRMHLSRAESILAGVKRHPFAIRMRTGCDAHGQLIAQEVDLLADAGAYASLGPAVLETALEHVAGPYEIANVESRGRLVYTNNGVCGAFRGFGANQMAFAVECQVDRLAHACGLSPIEFRRRNLKQPGTPGYLGQAVAPSERLVEMLAAAAASPLWRAPRGISDDGSEYVGVGMALNHHGNGLGSVIPDPAGGCLRLGPDGAIEAAFGLDEMGQGLLAAIKSVVAQQLGCDRADVRPVTGDTRAGPDSGSTTASRGTFVVWQTARLAGPEFTLKMCAAAGRALGLDPATLTLASGGFADRLSNSGTLLMSYAELARAVPGNDLPTVAVAFDYPKTNYTASNARFLFVFGACLARVAVSAVTGQVRVLDLNQHSASGPVLDVASYLGQQEGGAVQAMGFTLSEDMIMQGGGHVTTNFDTYMVPGIADAPERMVLHTSEDLDPGDPFGPRGAGELGIGAAMPAIANAIADAIGYFPAIMPVSPERLLDAMAARA